jgi:hypothetical protein
VREWEPEGLRTRASTSEPQSFSELLGPSSFARPIPDGWFQLFQAAQGLAYLHSHTPVIVHGDIKAANVLVNNQGDAMICDFGMATLLQDEATEWVASSGNIGTYRWYVHHHTRNSFSADGCGNHTGRLLKFSLDFQTLALAMFGPLHV